MIFVVNYHYIREQFDAPYPSIYGVTPEQLSTQLDTLGESASFLGIQDIMDIVGGRCSLPAKAAVITFDDGLKEQFELAWPILQKKGIPAILYVNSSPVESPSVTVTHKIHLIRSVTAPNRLIEVLSGLLKEKRIVLKLPDPALARSVYIYDTEDAARLKYFLNYTLNNEQQKLIVNQCFSQLGFNEEQINKDLYMDKEMITKLAKAGSLGSHGHSHRPLGLLEKEEALDDFTKSIDKLEEWTGSSIKTFSYPFGFFEACSKEVADLACKRGLKFAFTTERAANMDLNNPMFLGRFSPNDVFSYSSMEEFYYEIQYTRWFT